MSPPQGSAWGISRELLVLNALQPSCMLVALGSTHPAQGPGRGTVGGVSTVQMVLLFVQRLRRASPSPVGSGEELSSGEMERVSFLSYCFSSNALCALLADLAFSVIAPPPFSFFFPFCYQHLLSGLPFLKKSPLAHSEAPVMWLSIHQEAFQPPLAPIEADSKQSSPNARGLCTDLG